MAPSKECLLIAPHPPPLMSAQSMASLYVVIDAGYRDGVPARLQSAVKDYRYNTEHPIGVLVQHRLHARSARATHTTLRKCPCSLKHAKVMFMLAGHLTGTFVHCRAMFSAAHFCSTFLDDGDAGPHNRVRAQCRVPERSDRVAQSTDSGR
jgi:hypothetical protein